ncbi:MAG TPA: L-ribulose-5-phosphate 4-epimerase [Acidobacteriaceae bacterium]|nr:L-ribulose-5-phosphate 4-epimerase [Acidobacteriaceae bacterium]
MLDELRARVLEANLEIVRRGLVLYTFGNASGIDRVTGLVVIKPSGVPYETMTAADMVVSDLHGKIIEGELKPSSDLATHLELYRAFPAIGGIVHTHSEFATAWAQAGREIPPFGTTHADYFYGPVPVTEELSAEEIAGDYVGNTGKTIVRRFRNLDPEAVPGVLVAGHAPFAWGRDPMQAAYHGVVLEAIARMAFYTATLNPEARGVSQALLDRHYFRKHGEKATYGQ